MHYYKKNLGDYYKKAGRLSILQHGVYTLLIDACYDRECFPDLEEAIEWTWASTPEEVQAVEFVLKRFFTLTDGVYVQKRIQEELKEYQARADKNRQIAIQREAKRAEKSTKRDDKSTKRAQVVDESSPNQEPLTTNQEPETSEGGDPPTPPSPPPDKFEMHDNWQPDQMFSGQCRMAGIDFEKIPIDRGKQILAEFRGYWISVSTKREHTHGEWQHKLLQGFMRESQTGDLYDEKRYRTDQQRLTEYASNIYDYKKATDF